MRGFSRSGSGGGGGLLGTGLGLSGVILGVVGEVSTGPPEGSDGGGLGVVVNRTASCFTRNTLLGPTTSTLVPLSEVRFARSPGLVGGGSIRGAPEPGAGPSGEKPVE